MIKRYWSWIAKVLLISAFVCGAGLRCGLAADDRIGTEKPFEPVREEGIPKIRFDELGHEFGITNQGQTLEHVFTFKNIGTGLLHIEKLKAG